MYKYIFIFVVFDYEMLIVNKLDNVWYLMVDGGKIMFLIVLENIFGFVLEFVMMKIDNYLIIKIEVKLKEVIGGDENI